MANLLPPELWEGLPFGHPEARFDFIGTHQEWHRALAIKTGVADRLFDDLEDSLDRHNDIHQALAAKLNLAPSDDLSRYDLRQRQGWALWMQIHAIEHARLRAATGL